MTQEAAAKKDTQKLQRAIVDGLEDVKAQDIHGLQHRASVAPVRARDRRLGHFQPPDQGAGRQRARRGARGGLSQAAHRGRGQRRVDHRGLRRRRRPHHAAGHPAVLPPRGNLGRQAGAPEVRRTQAGDAAERRRSPRPRRRRAKTRRPRKNAPQRGKKLQPKATAKTAGKTATASKAAPTAGHGAGKPPVKTGGKGACEKSARQEGQRRRASRPRKKAPRKSPARRGMKLCWSWRSASGCPTGPRPPGTTTPSAFRPSCGWS